MMPVMLKLSMGSIIKATASTASTASTTSLPEREQYVESLLSISAAHVVVSPTNTDVKTEGDLIRLSMQADVATDDNSVRAIIEAMSHRTRLEKEIAILANENAAIRKQLDSIKALGLKNDVVTDLLSDLEANEKGMRGAYVKSIDVSLSDFGDGPVEQDARFLEIADEIRSELVGGFTMDNVNFKIEKTSWVGTKRQVLLNVSWAYKWRNGFTSALEDKKLMYTAAIKASASYKPEVYLNDESCLGIIWLSGLIVESFKPLSELSSSNILGSKSNNFWTCVLPSIATGMDHTYAEMRFDYKDRLDDDKHNYLAVYYFLNRTVADALSEADLHIVFRSGDSVYRIPLIDSSGIFFAASKRFTMFLGEDISGEVIPVTAQIEKMNRVIE
jgi:hypothetical protein